jgi:signal transduction histidine kinase
VGAKAAARGWGSIWTRLRRTAPASSVPAAPAPPPAAAGGPEEALRVEALLAARQVQRYEIERWRTAFDHLPEACLLLNQAGHVLFANRLAARLLQLEPQSPAGVAFEDLLQRGGGAERVRVTREPLVDGRGGELGTLVVLRDAGAETRQEGVLTEFLSHISHELKSPLDTIRSYAEMLMDGSVARPETSKEFFNVITEESCRLAKLVDNLLDLSKIDSGVLAPHPGRLRAEALLQELVRAVEPQARAKGLTLEARLAPNLPTAYADKDLLGVAVSNLISNAVKYTPEGGRIQVRARHEDGALWIEVEDTGLGIGPEDRQRIFEKFYRAQDPKVRQQPGTGLGLALARQIVSLHGGTLQVDTEPGRGSTFRIVLPVREREQREAFGLPEAK